MIDLLFEPSDPMSCVTTVAGPTGGHPRFLLELHTPEEDIRIEMASLQTVAFFRRAVLALHRDAVHLHGDDIRTRAMHYEPGPEPLPLWPTATVNA